MRKIKGVIARLKAGRQASASGDVHASRGLDALDKRDYHQAVIELEQAIEIGVRHYDLAEIHTILGRAYKRLGRHEDAISAHKRAIEIDHTSHKAWNNLGIAYLETSRLEEAGQCVEEALSLKPDYAFAQATLAAICIRRDRPEQAAELLNRAISVLPDLPEVHSNLALAYAMIGRFQDADQSLKRAVALGYENWQEVRRRIVTLQQSAEQEAKRAPLHIQGIVEALAVETVEGRDAAARQLRDLGKRGLSVEEGIIALTGAAREFPPRKYEFQDSSADLINAAAERPRSEYIPVVVDLYPTYNSRAKEAALALLDRLEDEAAAVAYMDILRQYARDGAVSALRVRSLIASPRHAAVFFPEILDYADAPALAFDIYLLCLTYFQHGLLAPGDLHAYAGQIVGAYDLREKALSASQRSEGIAWMWEDEYQKQRNSGALLLDLMGYFGTPQVEQRLYQALAFTDPRLKCFALCSLLRLGKDVDPAHVLYVARSAEMRTHLFEELGELGSRSLFPEEYRTQAAFAESDMVNWLSFPTELGRVPDEIDLMEVVGVDAGEGRGLLDFYLFRFRMYEPQWAAKDGWMAGVSGPFSRSDPPSTTSPGGTFSSFEPWESKTPEEHVESILEWIEQVPKAPEIGQSA
jgi:Flp pilus assembly protein TadD